MTSNSKGLPRQACAVQEDSLWAGCSLSVVGVRNNFDIVIWGKSSCPPDPPHDLWHLFVSANFRAATLQARRSSAVLQSGTSHANRDMSACADGPWNNKTVGRLLAHFQLACGHWVTMKGPCPPHLATTVVFANINPSTVGFANNKHSTTVCRMATKNEV